MDNNECSNKAVLSVKIEGVYCTSCVAVLTKSLLKHEGVSSVKVSPQLDEVRVEYIANSISRENLERLIRSAVSDSFISPQTELSENAHVQTVEFIPQTTVDPVCYMKVQIDENSLHSDYDEKRYYFCAKSCKLTFEKNPESYLNSEGEKR